MKEQHDPRRRFLGVRWTRRQRSLLVFWGAIALVLLLGLPRILADPDHTNNKATGAVIISEFGAAGNGPIDEYGGRPDWIELHNHTLTTVNLRDWTLTDDATQPNKWRFGDVLIEPGAYMIVFASSRDQDELDENELFLHTNFRLNSDGGFLALYPPTARLYADGTAYHYPPQAPQTSFALVEDSSGNWSPRYLAHPTPGMANDTSVSWAGILPPVSFDTPHGFYDAPIRVELSNPTADASIIYTTDGSTPTAETGIPYTGAIEISRTTPLRAVALLPDYAPSPVVTQSYLFMDDVRNQPAAPEGWPMTWGVHSLTRGPYIAGNPVEADYEMDSRVVNDPAFGNTLTEGLLEIPTLSLVTDMTNLDIFAMPQERGRVYERPVSIEWIDPNKTNERGENAGFQVNAGFRIQGNAGRLEYMPKHSFRLFFRQQYGAAKFDYPIFEDSHITEFETLILRGGVNRSFAGDFSDEAGNLDLRENTTYVHDEWARATQIAMSGAGSHGRFVHLYINGLYWGLYNMVERPDSSFSASYMGGDEEEWSSFNHGGAVNGAIDRFAVLLELARAGGLEEAEKYATFSEFFDAVQFSDYVILNWYGGNQDWPETNWYASVQNPAGRNRFWVWDAEATFNDGAAIRLGKETEDGAPFPNVVKLLFEAAWANPNFRITFADRLYCHLYNDGALTDDASTARWQELQAAIESAIVAESARWGDVRYSQPITVENWHTANENVLGQIEDNASKLIDLARISGYYPMIDPPAISPHGAEFTDEQEVTLSATNGAIYYTMDDSDPRDSVTGEPSASAQPYSAPVVITTTGVLKTRLLVDGVWSALNEATFAKSDEAAHLVISEIMYSPYLNENMEFIELTNVGNTAADLSGAYFEGIDFRFGDDVKLLPGRHLVLIRSLRDFRERYPEAEIYGQYRGKLSDKGEMISLYSPNGELWLQVTYDDNYGWPLSANSAGDSLVLVDPHGDMNSPHNWRASDTLYGTPGTDE